MGSKRGNGEGSIYQRSDGRWVAVLTMGLDDKGRRKRNIYMATQEMKLQRNWQLKVENILCHRKY